MARVTISSNNLFPGPRGAQGPAGPAGGPEGPTGSQGPQGNAGPQGPQGIQGPAGPTGAGGAQGLKGDTGNKGDKGDTGTAGTNGTNGTNGVGVPVGGTAGQALTKIDSTDYNDQWTTIPLLTTANTFTGGVQQITTASAASRGLVIQGSVSQTANLQEWTNNTPLTLAYITSTGRVGTGFVSNTANTGAYLDTGATATNSVTIVQRVTTAVNLIVRAVASQTGDLQQWQNSGGTVVAQVTSGGNVLGATLRTLTSHCIIKEESSGSQIRMTRSTASPTTLRAANTAQLYLRDGTTTGTLKLVIIGGTTGTETTILDNITQ